MTSRIFLIPCDFLLYLDLQQNAAGVQKEPVEITKQEAEVNAF
jgi:hypothetical protein